MTLEEAIAHAHNEFVKRLDGAEQFAADEPDQRTLDQTIAEAVRAWAKEEAELYFGGYGGYPTMHRHLAVPLDKFGGDE